MRVNYLIVLLAAIIMYLIFEIRGNKKLKLKDVPILTLFVGGPLGLVCCAILYIFSSTVCRVNPDGTFTDHDYIFFYKSENFGVKGVIPFNYYVDNETNRNIAYT